MGGGAFSPVLSAGAFPRIPPPVYSALKARILPKLSEFYTSVGVPIEAPEKRDHGDLDLLVCKPKLPYNTYVPHEIIKLALGAEHVIAMDANRTSNYAVLIARGEWGPFGYAREEDANRNFSEDGKIYYQVDIHPCLDENEFDRILFFHSYGDLGMILGLLARNNGLHLGSKGLKIPDPPNPPFDLSDSFDEIAQFLNLPLEPFHEGFKTKRDVFEWAASMKYFHTRHFRSTGLGITKVKAERTMYAEFVEWVEETQPCSRLYHELPREERVLRIRQDALAFFKKQQEFDDLTKSRLDRVRLKESFSGNRVRDWAQLGEHWKGVKLIMDEVRQRFGGEQGVLDFLNSNSEDDLKAVVLQVQAELTLKERGSLLNLLEKATLNENPAVPEEDPVNIDNS